MAKASSGTSTYGRVEELTACRFCIDINGLLVGIFKECTGLGGEIEVETYPIGGVNGADLKLPGRARYSHVTLKSGVASAVDLWEWFYKVAMGNVSRRDLSIVMLNGKGGSDGEVMRWNLSEAFPVRWTGPNFAAGDANVAVHSIELAHHGLELKKR